MEEKFVPKFEVNSKPESKDKPTSKIEPVKVDPSKSKESDKVEHGGLTVNCDKPANEDVPDKKTADTGVAAKTEPAKQDIPDEPAKQDEPKKSGFYSLKTDTYHAWVTQNGESCFQANLELVGGSTYSWSAESPEEAEQILAYHVKNQKL